MADYFVGLFLKYFFRAVIMGVGLCLVIEVAMQVDGLRERGPLEIHVFDLVSEIMPPSDREDGAENLVAQLLAVAAETSKVWGLSILLVIGFGVPLGVISGRLACAGMHVGSGWRVTARLVMTPCLLLIWVPTFGLASLLVLYLINVTEVPVFELMKNGGQGFEGDDVYVAEWWRLLLPTSVVAFSGAAWLAREVAQILWMTHQMDFVRAAEDRGLSGGRLFFCYTMNNSMCRIGGAFLRLCFFMLGSLILVEWVFRFPGLGLMIRTAAAEDDLARLFAGGVLLALMVLAAGLLLEVFFGMIDKNTRMRGGVDVMSDEKLAISSRSEAKTAGGNKKFGGKSNRQWRVGRVRRLKLAWFVVLMVSGVLMGIHMLEVLSGGVLKQGELIEQNARRILLGAGGTLGMGLMSSILAMLVSFCIVGLSGWLGGWRTYGLIVKMHTALFSMPAIFWVFVGLAVASSGFWSVILILGCVGGLLGVGVVSQWFVAMELCGWIEAAQAAGLKRRQVFLRHFFPAIWPMMVSRTLLLVPTMLLLAVAVDFSGLVETEGDSNCWGVLMAEGMSRMLDDPKLLIYSVVAVWVMAVSIAVLASWAKFENGDQPGPDIY